MLDTTDFFSTFGEDEAGELYVAHLGPDTPSSGVVYHIISEVPGFNAVLLAQNTIDQDWQSVSLPETFSDPVVIAGPPTFHGGQPGVVRLRNLTGSSFQTHFQEWLFLDGLHVQETLPYLVVESGRNVMSDGSVWEAGSFPLGGTAAWQAEVFSAPFAAPPALFLTIQTFNGGQPVTVRARNVTTNGFEAALFEEEALMDGHLTEEVGYLAIHSPQGSGSIGVGGSQMPYLLQRPSIDHRFVPALSSTLKLEEEKSKDAEVVHVQETVSVLALGDKLFAQLVSFNGGETVALRRLAPEYGAPMEWGTVDGVTHGWTTVALAKSFTDPVVVAKPVSANGSQPGVIRVRNVTGSSFDLRYQEWLYLDGVHIPERVFYLVAERGVFSVAGLTVEAGKLDTNTLLGEGWELVDFSALFLDSPAVFTSVNTFNGTDPVATRVDDVTMVNFLVTMDAEEAKADGHTTETLGWIAIERGTGTTGDNRAVHVGQTTADHRPTGILFGTSSDRQFPVFVADIVSTFGPDPVFLRYQNLDPFGVDLFLQEDQSFDAEVSHVTEDVSLFVAE